MKTSTLISKIRLGMSLPNIENRFSDSTLLELANDEIQSTILPWLFSLREDYLIGKQEFNLTTITNGIIEFPQYSSGRTLKDLWVSEDGKAYRPLQRIGLDEAWRFNESDIDIPHAFSVQGDRIYLHRKPSANTIGTLRLYYHILPNTLVSVSRGITITSLSGDDTIVTAQVPTFITAGSNLDVIYNTADYQVFLRSQTVSSVTQTTITFSGYGVGNTLADAGFAPGLILCLEGETIETPLPIEVNQLLIQAVIIRVLESLNAPQQLSLALERFARLKTQLRDILTPRSENRLLKFRPNYPFLRNQRVL